MAYFFERPDPEWEGCLPVSDYADFDKNFDV